MPFTLSHPAASVPFARRGLVLSALVVGSLAPDFEYFLWLAPESRFSHTLYGVFLFCVPIGLVVLWLFHKILKRPILSLLPVSHQRRLIPVVTVFSFGPLWRFALIVMSLVLGALTHIAWDSFTHQNGWMVQQVSLLNSSIIGTDQGSIQVYKVLQHGSTLIGAALLCYWYARWFRQTPAQPAILLTPLSTTTRFAILFSMGLGALALAGIYGFVGVSSISDIHSFRQFVGRAVVASMVVLFVELIIFSALWHLGCPKSERQ
jgi:hypothetical protein